MLSSARSTMADEWQHGRLMPVRLNVDLVIAVLMGLGVDAFIIQRLFPAEIIAKPGMLARLVVFIATMVATAAATAAADRGPSNVVPRPLALADIEQAFVDGDLGVLIRATGEGHHFLSPMRKGLCRSAALHGHLHVLQWLRYKGCPWDDTAFSGAVRNGHLEMLQWLNGNGCPQDETACSAAAEGGDLQVLLWLRNNGCPWNERACSYAARNGHLHVLMWLRGNGCPWDEVACTLATLRRHLGVLQWLRGNDCPWDRRACLRVSRRYRYVEITAWIRNH